MNFEITMKWCTELINHEQNHWGKPPHTALEFFEQFFEDNVKMVESTCSLILNIIYYRNEFHTRLQALPWRHSYLSVRDDDWWWEFINLYEQDVENKWHCSATAQCTYWDWEQTKDGGKCLLCAHLFSTQYSCSAWIVRFHLIAVVSSGGQFSFSNFYSVEYLRLGTEIFRNPNNNYLLSTFLISMTKILQMRIDIWLTHRKRFPI